MSAVHADCFARGSSHAVHTTPGRALARTAAQRRFRLNDHGQARIEDDIRLEERCKERARIVHELHDTLFQGFVGASMLLDHAVEQTPADSPSKSELSRALRLIHRALDDGRAAMRGLHVPSVAPLSLDQAFSNLLEEVTPRAGVQLRVVVQGKPRTLTPAIQEQVFLIGREAVMNALRHSEATNIDVEVQYLCDLTSVCVHDNGCGINSKAVQKESDSHWGLRGMRARAEKIDARFDICSRPGVGTAVRVAVPVDAAKADNP
jgi:signal transduction histidine kinase